MKTNYVLIDFENVHVKSLALLKGDNFQVKVFLGPKNAKLPVELVLAVQTMGNRANYIQLPSSSKDALDFHIAYYLGKLAAKDPQGLFTIISKDTGFDSLIKHLLANDIHCKRSPSIEQMLGAVPAPRILVEQQKAAPKPAKPRTAATPAKPKAVPVAAAPKTKPAIPVTATLRTVIENLQARGSARPRTVKTLTSSIKSLRLNLSDEQIAGLIAELQALEKIKVNGVQVAYKL